MANIFQALRQRIIGHCRLAPDSMNQFILADKPPIVFDQILQDFKRLGAQLDLFRTTQKTATRQVEPELVKRKCLVSQLLHGNVRQFVGVQSSSFSLCLSQPCQAGRSRKRATTLSLSDLPFLARMNKRDWETAGRRASVSC